MAHWSVRRLRAGTAERFSAAQAALAGLNSDLDRLLGELAELGVDVARGEEIVVPVHDVAFAERFHAELHRMSGFGAAAPGDLLDGDEVRRIVPALTDHVRAGFVLPGNRALDPRRYVDTLISALESRGVVLLEGRSITGFDVHGDRVRRVRTNQGPLDADELVLAAGAGIRALGRPLGLRLDVVAGQGYNVALPPSSGLDRPVIVEEVHAVATPFADRIRLGGTMELAGDSPPFNSRRVETVVRSMRPFLDLEWTAQREPWSGPRPMSADGLPLIGRPRAFSNVVVAGGHGMFGLTLAPATARVVADLIVDGGTSADLSAFDPDR
jgi:D-amino-acid dehydrogenase